MENNKEHTVNEKEDEYAEETAEEVLNHMNLDFELAVIGYQ